MKITEFLFSDDRADKCFSFCFDKIHRVSPSFQMTGMQNVFALIKITELNSFQFDHMVSKKTKCNND